MKTRFLLNMGRIHGLVQLLFSNDALKPVRVFRSEGPRADVLRSVVVFLHATFEVVLRSHVPERYGRLSFYSRGDLDKALRLSGVDATPFRPLYPTLTQMAKRRKRIVHDADLANRTDTVSRPWGVADDWQLIMWLLAVPAFYYRLLAAFNDATPLERSMYQGIRKAMALHADFGKQLAAFAETPADLKVEGLASIVVTLTTLVETLKLDAGTG